MTVQFYSAFLEKRVDWLSLDEDEEGVVESRSDHHGDYNKLAIANVDNSLENKELYDWLNRYLKYKLNYIGTMYL